MGKMRVNVLGPAQVQLDGITAKLSPRALRVLVRLISADGEPVGVRQLRWDLWRQNDRPRNARNGRNQVQKGVSELRRVLDPQRSGAAGEVLRTERLFSGSEAQSAYRLVLDAESLDAAEFAALVREALHGTAASAADQLTRALSLWRGQPLPEAGDDEYAAGLVEKWRAQYLTALRELVRLHCELERFDLALPVAERLAAEFPDDLQAATGLMAVRGKIRERHGDEIFRRDFHDLRTCLTIIRGDLLDQDDANLVVGFADTFDVDTRDDVVISRASLQGQLLERLYGGDTASLNRDLRRGLSAVPHTAEETRQAKPRGKRIRYPIGTVVAIPNNGRRIFATAYSRLGNDLVARARPEELESALDRVWESAAMFGQLAPIAVPVVGSGLSRITELGPEQLMCMIVGSFLSGCRKHSTVAPALRIVLRPADLERTDMTLVAKAISALEGTLPPAPMA
jgi:Thoeris protein ThsA, Macro domain/Bacterial transcriptional activator domain